MLDFSKLDIGDAEVVTQFLSGFGYPEMPEELKVAIENFKADESDENRAIFGKTLIKVLATNPDFGLDKAMGKDLLFDKIQERIVEANDEWNKK